MTVSDIPVYLNCRDRVSDLRGMVEWLEAAGQQRIILLDNASTYEPLLEFYETTHHEVVRLGRNVGHMAIFWGMEPPPCPFFYSDPDLVFLGPHSGLEWLYELAKRHSARDKVGFGLTLDGVPEDMPSLAWERTMWEREVESEVYDAPLDTTFAIYNRPTQDIWNSLRTGGEHVVRHSSWYVDPHKLSEEDAYYLAKCEGPSSSWARSLTNG